MLKHCPTYCVVILKRLILLWLWELIKTDTTSLYKNDFSHVGWLYNFTKNSVCDLYQFLLMFQCKSYFHTSSLPYIWEKLLTVRAADLKQMDTHMNKLQGSQRSSSFSLLAWPGYTKCYSSHMEKYNENIILLGERCCALSESWQMDGWGNMLHHRRPATTLAELCGTQVSMINAPMLPPLTQLLPVAPCLHCLDFTHICYHIALLASWLTHSRFWTALHAHACAWSSTPHTL